MLDSIRAFIDKHFTKLSPKEKEEVIENIKAGSCPSNDFYVMTGLAAVIATLGIIIGSTVVVIGAMVVAPLLTPLLSSSLAGVRGEITVFNKSLKEGIKGALLSIVIAIIIGWIIPEFIVNTEFLMSTQPTLINLGIAFASGLAGAYAVAKRLDFTLPGIAISVSLIPPLCVAGLSIGLRLGWEYTTGSLLLFIANVISITLAGYIVFWLVGLGPIWYWDEAKSRKRIYTSIALMILIAIPLGWIMWTTWEERHTLTTTQEVLEGQLSGIKYAEINAIYYEDMDDGLRVVAEIESPSLLDHERVAEMEYALGEELKKDVDLELKIILIETVDSEN